MQSIKLLGCIITIGFLFGCATQATDNQQLAVNDNPAVVDDSANSLIIPPPMANEAGNESETAADATPAVIAMDTNCEVKGKTVMLDGVQIGVTVNLGYCDANPKPEGSPIWIPAAEVPAVGNISVDDQCNITYCPTAPHYDHFGITNGTNSIQVQVRWQGDQAMIN